MTCADQSPRAVPPFGPPLRHLLGLLIVAGVALAAERQLVEMRDAELEHPSLTLYAQMLEAPPVGEVDFVPSSDDLDGGIQLGPSRPLELHVRWVFAPAASGSLWASSRGMVTSLLQVLGLLLLAILLRQLGDGRQSLDARLRPTPSLPAFFTCCALAALLPQLMLLRHEHDAPSSLAIASAATLVYAASWMAARRSALWRALRLASSSFGARTRSLVFLPVRVLRLEGDLVRVAGEPYERTAVVEFADGARGRVDLEHADLDESACAELVRTAQRQPSGEVLWVLGRLERGQASADAAEPLCREVTSERRIEGGVLLLGMDRQRLFHQLACELLILASVATLAAAFLLSRPR